MYTNWKVDVFDPVAARSLGESALLAYQVPTEVQKKMKTWNLELLEYFDVAETQAFLARTRAADGAMILAFRGTQSLKDWMTDVDINLVNGPGGKVHDGFLCALNTVWRPLTKLMDATREHRKLWITGHSLGGALATLATAKLRLEKAQPVSGLYTFGSPRVGNEEFARNFDADFYYQYYRVVNNNDVVPRIPFRLMAYRHVGIFKYFDITGKINEKITWADITLDRLKGRIEDFLDPNTDGIKDHAMTRYIGNLIKLISMKRSVGR